MSTVLSRAITIAGISLLLNTLVYIFMGRDIRSTIITYISIWAVFFAIFVVLGYITTYLSKIHDNFILHSTSIFLLGLNAFLLAKASLFILNLGIKTPPLLFTLSYVIIGIYVYWETIKAFRQINQYQNKKGISQGDLLDDGV